MARRGENIYKRKDGRYEGRYIKYHDSAGKAVYGYVYAKRYAQVKALLAARKTEKTFTHDNTLLFGTWLHLWLSSQHTLKPTTKRVYQSHIRNHLLPRLGKIPLKKLNNKLLQDCMDDLDLSTSTVKTIFSIIKSALAAAEEKGWITNCPRNIKIAKKETSIVTVFTIREQKQLERLLVSDFDIGIWLSLYAGLRIGEVCALKWTDIRLDTFTLTVNGTQARTDNGLEILSPKSKSSRREIPLVNLLVEKLQSIPATGEFVLSRNEKPVDVRTYRRYFKRLLQTAGLPDIKYHALRHTFATRALEVGMDYKTLSEILGHASVGITLDLYTHSLTEHKRNQMNKLNHLFDN